MAIIDSIRAYYNFNETTWTGVINNNNPWTYNGTKTNVTINQTGKIDKAYSFGTDSHVNIANSWQFSFDNSAFSISMRINPTTRWTNYATLIDFEDSWRWGWLIRHSPVSWNLWWNNDQQLSNWVPSTWERTHVVFTSNWTNGKMYFNGSLNYTQASLTYNWNSTSTYWIWWNVEDTTQWFQWLIDEVWIWAKELSATEITSLYNWWAWLTYPFTSNANFFQFIS